MLLSTKLIMTVSLSALNFPLLVPQRNHTGSNTHHDYSTRMMMMLTHASNAALLVVGLLVALVSAVEGMFTAEMVG